MAILKPFRSIRPRADIADRISALPYDVYTSAEARAEIRKEPLSFLKIDRPETNFPEGTDMYSPEVYERAASAFKSMERDGSFIQDEKDMFYLYELSMDGRSQTGIVGLSAVSDFESGSVQALIVGIGINLSTGEFPDDMYLLRLELIVGVT